MQTTELTEHQRSQLELIDWIHKVKLRNSYGFCLHADDHPITLRLCDGNKKQSGLYLVCNDYCCEQPATVQQVKAYLDLLGIHYHV